MERNIALRTSSQRWLVRRREQAIIYALWLAWRGGCEDPT
jgi:hypothetical protein